MKYVKLSLILVVVTGLFFAVSQIISKQPPPPPPPIEVRNDFISEIEDSLNILQSIYDSATFKDFKNRHMATSTKVTLFAVGNNFDRNDFNRNTQIKENFERSLYALYVKKFIKSTFSLLNTANWDLPDFRLLQQEKNSLLASQYLSSNSSTADSLRILQSIFDQYDSVYLFYQSCNTIDLSFVDISIKFPKYEINQKMLAAEYYLANNLNNIYVNNSSLRSSLENVPEFYFNKHISYLNQKFAYLEQKYSSFSSMSQFENLAFNSLKEEINALNLYPSEVDPNGNAYSQMARRLTILYRSADSFFN